MRYMMMLLAVVMAAGCAEEEDPVLWELAPDNPPGGVVCFDVDDMRVLEIPGGDRFECQWDCVTYKGKSKQYVALTFQDGELIEEFVSSESSCK